MEQIHGVIYGIVTIHMKSETGGTLPPAMLESMGKFTECVVQFRKQNRCSYVHRTLHKLYTFVTEQQDGSKLKHFFRQSEMNMLLKDCQLGMKRAVDVFKVIHVHNL